jgi:hypothetical protein
MDNSGGGGGGGWRGQVTSWLGGERDFVTRTLSTQATPTVDPPRTSVPG